MLTWPFFYNSGIDSSVFACFVSLVSFSPTPPVHPHPQTKNKQRKGTGSQNPKGREPLTSMTGETKVQKAWVICSRSPRKLIISCQPISSQTFWGSDTERLSRRTSTTEASTGSRTVPKLESTLGSFTFPCQPRSWRLFDNDSNSISVFQPHN